MTKRNPKQEGSNLFDCIPQIGPCPIKCNQCFYNRPDAFYVSINKPHIPSAQEVGNGIVRMNCGHDSNINRDLVIAVASKYEKVFFNTSLPLFDFPAPVVFTANRKEEEMAYITSDIKNLMFVRLRTSSTNLGLIEKAIKGYTQMLVPIVLTFMAYYDDNAVPDKNNYEWKIRHINSYWCPTYNFKEKVMKKFGGELVTMCGTLDSNYCKDCGNCERFYYMYMRKHKK